jgi:hypothetical protein
VLGLSIRTLRNKIRIYIAEGIEVPAHQEQGSTRGFWLQPVGPGSMPPTVLERSPPGFKIVGVKPLSPPEEDKNPDKSKYFDFLPTWTHREA